MLPATLRCVLAALLIVALPMAALGAGKATVRDAESVNVREAPSAESPVLLSLRKGREVTVEKVVGDWALITLEGGRQGYIRTLYLALPAGIGVVAGPAATPEIPAQAVRAQLAPTAPSPLPTPPATLPAMPADTPAAPQTPADLQADAGFQREVAELRQRLAALESAVVATPGDVPVGTRHGPDPNAPVASDERESTRGPLIAPTVARLTDPQEIGPSLALAGVGLVVGFLFGTAYGRRQERNRRTRVRF